MAVIIKPFTFVNGTVADANEVNSDIDTVYTVINGNLDQANLATDSVNTSEIVNASVTDAKIAWGTGATQVSAADMPIADAGAFYPTDFVESALQEISQGTRATSWQISRGAVNPLNLTHAALTAPRTWTLQDATDTIVGRATTDTLTNKSLTSPGITGTVGGGASYTAPTLTSPTFSGTIAGTPTASGVWTFTPAPTFSAGVIFTAIADPAATIGLHFLSTTTANSLKYYDPALALRTLVDLSLTQTLVNKTLTSPTIADFTNAGHNHQNATGGGVLDIINATSGTLTVARGGTGGTTFTANGVVLGNAGAALTVTAAGAANTVFRVPGAGGAPAFGAVDLASAMVTGTLPVGNGGTGVTTSTGTTNVVLSNSPTIVTPTIASFVNATHNHEAAAGGGTLAIVAATTGTLTVARGGTGVTTSTGTTNVVLSNTPTITDLHIASGASSFQDAPWNATNAYEEFIINLTSVAVGTTTIFARTLAADKNSVMFESFNLGVTTAASIGIQISYYSAVSNDAGTLGERAASAPLNNGGPGVSTVQTTFAGTTMTFSVTNNSGGVLTSFRSHVRLFRNF